MPVTPNTKHNDGTKKDGDIIESFGKDDSDVSGSKSDEQGKDLAGGVNNIAHSISGASATNDAQKDTNNSKETIR